MTSTDAPLKALRERFAALGFSPESIAFLCKVWDAIQFLDDVKDGDIPDPDAIYTLIVGLPCDPFLGANREALMPMLVTCYHKWQAANHAERNGMNLDQAYVWRAGFYDLALLVAAIQMPADQVEKIAFHVLSTYGESRDDYLKEMSHA